MRFVLAILPVLLQYGLEALKEWWSIRNSKTVKKRVGKMHEAIKDRDIDRVNKLFNSVCDKNKARKKPR